MYTSCKFVLIKKYTLEYVFHILDGSRDWMIIVQTSVTHFYPTVGYNCRGDKAGNF